MTRIRLPLLLCALVLAGVATACAGHTEPASNGDAGGHTEPPAGGDAGVSATAGPCTIVPADYDQSCNSDSDCTTVLPGGDTCDPCAQSYLFTCGQAPINAQAAAAYTAALTKALPAPPGIKFAATVCGHPVSCPRVEVVTCVHGQCALVQ